MKKLTEKEIKNKLEALPGWEYNEGAIHTVFEFQNFKETFSLMVRIAFEAEVHHHHPKWTNVYNQLAISLSTHDAGGVTQKDFDLAKTIESIVETP